MVLTALALVVGLVAGRLPLQGHRHLAEPRLRALPLLVAGLALQIATGPLGVGVLLPCSYAALAIFVFLNLPLVGMPVVLVGICLNLLVITVNGGMPVSADALVGAGLADASEIDSVRFQAGRHLEDGGDLLPVLGDTIPVSPLGQVVSFGDLILLVGIADVVAHLSQRRHRRSPRRTAISPYDAPPGSAMLRPEIRVTGARPAVAVVGEGTDEVVPTDARPLVGSASHAS